jgi:hypothetical protein
VQVLFKFYKDTTAGMNFDVITNDGRTSFLYTKLSDYEYAGSSYNPAGESLSYLLPHTDQTSSSVLSQGNSYGVQMGNNPSLPNYLRGSDPSNIPRYYPVSTIDRAPAFLDNSIVPNNPPNIQPVYLPNQNSSQLLSESNMVGSPLSQIQGKKAWVVEREMSSELSKQSQAHT